MPPRLRALLSVRSSASQASLTPLASRPLVQARSASILSSLSNVPSSYGHRIRRGRGPSSGKGKTSGRGHKGQKQHGKVPALFQGGQTPLIVVRGKRGFKNQFSVDMAPVNLGRIQSWIDQGRIDPTRPITVKELVESRCIHNPKDGVKLLADGKDELKVPIDILVSRASAAAIEAVEAAGGKIMTRYYTKESIQRLLRGESISTTEPFGLNITPSETLESKVLAEVAARAEGRYRLPDPTGRKDIEYYRDAAHRGYLSHLVAEGHGPSLFFKTPGTETVHKQTKEKDDKKDSENRVW